MFVLHLAEDKVTWHVGLFSTKLSKEVFSIIREPSAHDGGAIDESSDSFDEGTGLQHSDIPDDGTAYSNSILNAWQQTQLLVSKAATVKGNIGKFPGLTLEPEVKKR